MSDCYHYKTKVGVFWIKPEPGAPGGYLLGIQDMSLGSYPSPMLAADDVYIHATGWDDWDSLDGDVDAPNDIGEWSQGVS